MSADNLKRFIITRKRKKYKFAKFANFDNCYELDQINQTDINQTQIVEIGAGTGDFSLALAKQLSNKHLIALDIKADRLQAGAERAIESKLDNLSFVRAYVRQFDERLINPSLEQLWITFCDPYPKDRSAKHRLTHRHYLDIYANWLSKDGMLYFKTDNDQLFDFTLLELSSNSWEVVSKTRDLHSSDFNENYKITTAYERKYIEQGKNINFLIARPPKKL